MRRSFLLILLFACTHTAFGQWDFCPHDSTDAVADTLDWQGYYPLEVGNYWFYSAGYVYSVEYKFVEIATDTLIDNRPFWKLETSWFEFVGQDTLRQRTPHTTYLSVTDSVFWHWNNGEYTAEAVRLGADFNTCYSWWHEDGDGYEEVVAINGGYDPYPRKSFSFYWYDRTFSYGVGQRSYRGEFYEEDLIFAQVGDSLIGNSWFEYYIILDQATPPAIPQSLSAEAFPNPFQDHLTLALTVPQAGEAVITLFDAVGREAVTQRQTLTPGRHQLPLSLPGLAPGPYFVHIRLDQQVVTRLVIRL